MSTPRAGAIGRSVLAVLAVMVAMVLGWPLVVPGEDDDQWAPMPYPGDRFPTWDPAGDRILFASNRGLRERWTLYELVLETGRIAPVLPWGMGGEGGHYDPSGQRIVFQFGAQVAVFDRETGTGRNLGSTSDPGDAGFDPRFRTAEQVVFWRQPRRHNHNAIFQVSVGEELAKRDLQVLIQSDHDVRMPRPSPTGDRLAYVEVIDDASGSYRGGQTNISVWDAEAGETTVVFASAYALDLLEWFPDGEHLLVSARGNTDTTPMAYILNLRTNSPEELRLPSSQIPAILPEITISPDGAWYCYPASSSQGYGVTLWRARTDGTGAEEITHAPGWYYQRFPDPAPVRGCELIFGDPDIDPMARP